MTSLRQRRVTAVGLLSLILAAWLIGGCSERTDTESLKILGLLNKSMKTYDCQGLTIRYQEAGEGKPIIFLHGFGAAAYSWRYLTPILAENFRTMAFDLKGFGLSAKPRDDKYSILDQAAIVTRFIEDEELEEVSLVGNSLGGAVALITYLNLAPSKRHLIKALVLIDTPAFADQRTPFFRILGSQFIGGLMMRLIPTGLRTKLVLRRVYFDDAKITEDQLATYASLAQLPNATYAALKSAQQILPPNVEDFTRKLRGVKAPVLILWGEGDVILPLREGLRLAQEIPTARLATIPECGHAPQEECPAESLRIIREFLLSHAE